MYIGVISIESTFDVSDRVANLSLVYVIKSVMNKFAKFLYYRACDKLVKPVFKMSDIK